MPISVVRKFILGVTVLEVVGICIDVYDFSSLLSVRADPALEFLLQLMFNEVLCLLFLGRLLL